MARAVKQKFSEATLRMIADRFKVLAEPMRLKILHSLSQGERTVSAIIGEIGGLQANVSKHLGMLLQAGLLTRRKEGLCVYYSVSDETVFDLCEAVCASLHERLVAQMKEINPRASNRKRA